MGEDNYDDEVSIWLAPAWYRRQYSGVNVSLNTLIIINHKHSKWADINLCDLIFAHSSWFQQVQVHAIGEESLLHCLL